MEPELPVHKYPVREMLVRTEGRWLFPKSPVSKAMLLMHSSGGVASGC